MEVEAEGTEGSWVGIGEVRGMRAAATASVGAMAAVARGAVNTVVVGSLGWGIWAVDARAVVWAEVRVEVEMEAATDGEDQVMPSRTSSGERGAATAVALAAVATVAQGWVQLVEVMAVEEMVEARVAASVAWVAVMAEAATAVVQVVAMEEVVVAEAMEAVTAAGETVVGKVAAMGAVAMAAVMVAVTVEGVKVVASVEEDMG